MAETILETKRWGNSIGIVLPKEILETEHIKGEHEKVFVIIKKGGKTAGRSFGALNSIKWKKSAQELKNEIKKELYD